MPTEQAKDFADVSYVHILSKMLEMVHLLLSVEPILVNLYLLPNSPYTSVHSILTFVL